MMSPTLMVTNSVGIFVDFTANVTGLRIILMSSIHMIAHLKYAKFYKKKDK